MNAIRKVLDEAKANSGLPSDDPSVAALEQIMQAKVAELAESRNAVDPHPPPTGTSVLFAPPEEGEKGDDAAPPSSQEGCPKADAVSPAKNS